MNNKIEEFWNSLYSRGISSKKDLVREMIRIKLTEDPIENSDLHQKDITADQLYDIMKNITEAELGDFPEDRDFFQEIYRLAKEIDLQVFTIQTYKHDRMGTMIAPIHLTDYMEELIEQQGVNTVLITDAEKSLIGLKKNIEKSKHIQFTLTSENKMTFLLLKLIFKRFDNTCVKHQSIYKKLLMPERFDLVLCLPVFGVKFDQEEVSNKYMTRESEGIAVENLLEVIDHHGKLFVIVPARFTFSGGGFEQIRHEIMTQYGLESIYTLPEGTFRPYTGIKTYMLGIANEPVLNVKLGHLALEEETFKLKDQKKIPKTEFNKYSDWRVELFLSKNQDDLQKFKQSAVQKIKLKDIADIFRGKSVMKKDIQPGKIHILNISNIEDGHIVFEHMDTIDEEERKIKRYELLEHDLVITCRGTINKVAVYKGSQKCVIASANIMVIRFKEAVMSDYVKIFMESPLGRTMIKSFQRGSTVMNINPKDIGEMEVPIANLAEQKAIVAEYLHENKLYIETIKKAEQRWAIQQQEIFEKILK